MAKPAEPTLLDIAAHAPGAAALIAGALGDEDLKALRLTHPAMRDAVAEVVVKIVASSCPDGGAAPARPPTARRWPALEHLELPGRGLVGPWRLHALRDEPWPRLGELCLGSLRCVAGPRAEESGVLAARALAAAAPCLASLTYLRFADGVSAAELEEALSVEWASLEFLAVYNFEAPAAAGAPAPPARALAAQPRLCSATLLAADDAGAAVAARWLVARRWPLEWLYVDVPDAESLAALVAAPALALESLELMISMDAADLRALAAAPWPLEGLGIHSVVCAWLADDSLALAALARHARLETLEIVLRGFSTAAFKALAAAAWPELTFFSVAAEEDDDSEWEDDEGEEGEALDAASFARCPKLERLCLRAVPMGAASARALASRRWARLEALALTDSQLDDAALAALARGAWPALERLDLSRNAGIRAPPTLADVQRWAPTVTELEV